MKASDRSSLVTRNTLNVLKILNDLKACKFTRVWVAKSIIEKITMMQSKSFIGSLMYPIGPSATTLITISMIKIPVNVKFILIIKKLQDNAIIFLDIAGQTHHNSVGNDGKHDKIVEDRSSGKS
jgi:hypothetical protein